MPRYFSDQLLYRLRNEIPLQSLMKRLDWPHKRRDAQLVFLCPCCHEFLSVVYSSTNLGHCFYHSCKQRFNTIELTMAVQKCSFVDAVHYLIPLLPAVGRAQYVP